MTAIVQHITNNTANIIQDMIFAFIGVLLGILFTPKSNNPQTGNGSSIYQTMQIIYQSINTTNNYHPHRPSRKRSSSNEDDSPLGIWIVGTIFVAFLFVKFHAEIMNYFTGFILLALGSTVTIAIKLHMNNQYDNLNRFWTIVSLLIIGVDFFTLKLMSNQISTSVMVNSFSDFISSVGMNGVMKYAYLALGFLMVILPNVLLSILLLHMYAVNIYLVSGGRISQYIIRKTSPFTIKPAVVAIIGFILCGMSLLFSSGLMYDLISKTEHNSNTVASRTIEQIK